ncbi:HAD-like protein [Punctularia strigosozonata HHB-11173 SS5]|uniref:HAD-like protein n=1 Tax=Punctularia strigosozonata (strain HHB-11173) TaxID=741275 RepID=UPI00044173CC|nr:HAD-like protein [Punctularia strigosozonata HHB-11173 SS5]EIN08301.1 HAD-like protein [Punctularia strigosozonata HHB-11173 SS5]
MSAPPLSHFKLLVFDVYGTLVDWETGLYTALKPLLAMTSGNTWSKREALQAFSSVEKDLQAKYPDMLYSYLLAKGHADFAARLKSESSAPAPTGSTTAQVETSSAEASTTTTTASTSAGTSAAGPTNDSLSSADIAFGQSIKDWPVFPDSVAALATLSKHYKLVVLSNVDEASFAHTKAALEHGFAFDEIITAEDVGAWKPSTRGHQYVLDVAKQNLGIEASQVLVTAQSLWHDHTPANKLGLSSVWIDRAGATIGIDNPEKYQYLRRFATLGEMAAAVDAGE